MYIKSILILICALCAVLATFAFASQTPSQPEIKWTGWSDASFVRARQENRLILVYGKSEWCHWCQKMESTTLRDPTLVNMINNTYIPIRIDIDKNSGIAIQLKMVDLPSVILLDADRKVIQAFSGYFPPDEMIKNLNKVTLSKKDPSIQTASKKIHITIIGKEHNADTVKLYEAARSYKNAEIEWIKQGNKSKVSPDLTFPALNKPAAFVCINNHCSFPIFSPENLGEIIQKITLTTQNKQNKALRSINTEENKAANILKNQNVLFIVTGFWLFGLLLAFTPCVLPLILLMVTFLSGRTGEISRTKTFGLSCTYVFSLSLTYAAAGIIASVFGIYIQAYFQNRWILGLFSLLFFLLALSLLDVYKLELPESWRRFFVKFNKFQNNYTHIQVALMGVFATLIVSPCVAAPLAGVLSYVGSSGNITLGGLALFAVGLGIGTPLLIASIMGVNALPKKQKWQEAVKAFFGLLLIGMAIWLLDRIIPKSASMILWSILVIFTGIYIGALKKSRKTHLFKLLKTLSIMLLVYGIALFVGALIGNTDPLHPLQSERFLTTGFFNSSSSFKNIKTLDDLQKNIESAKKIISLFC